MAMWVTTVPEQCSIRTSLWALIMHKAKRTRRRISWLRAIIRQLWRMCTYNPSLNVFWTPQLDDLKWNLAGEKDEKKNEALKICGERNVHVVWQSCVLNRLEIPWIIRNSSYGQVLCCRSPQSPCKLTCYSHTANKATATTTTRTTRTRTRTRTRTTRTTRTTTQTTTITTTTTTTTTRKRATATTSKNSESKTATNNTHEKFPEWFHNAKPGKAQFCGLWNSKAPSKCPNSCCAHCFATGS